MEHFRKRITAQEEVERAAEARNILEYIGSFKPVIWKQMLWICRKSKKGRDKVTISNRSLPDVIGWVPSGHYSHQGGQNTKTTKFYSWPKPIASQGEAQLTAPSTHNVLCVRAEKDKAACTEDEEEEY